MMNYPTSSPLESTAWVDEHRTDPTVRIVEVDVNTSAYTAGHIPGALGWDWTTQLADQQSRDILPQKLFEQLMADSGITNDTTVVLYGDNNNWFAAWALWQLKLYGHRDVRIMDGGRKKWLAEGRPLSCESTAVPQARYAAHKPDFALRAFLSDVQSAARGMHATLVDVRSPEEFTGAIIAPPGLPETAQRGGHIPGAVNVPWSQTCNEDGTFKSPETLRALYGGKGVKPEQPIITYCRIGERSAHSWFVLKYLLGYRDVRNYDGSWTEWGNLVGAPVARDA